MTPTFRLCHLAITAIVAVATPDFAPGQALRTVDRPSIPGLNGHAVAYDAARERIVLFGGLAPNSELLDSTWTWNGSNWEPRVTAVAPSPRRWHSMAFDRARRKVVLFGGSDLSWTDNDETWEWDGTTWSQRNPVHRPPASSWTSMAYDMARQRTVLVRNLDSRTWEWDGSDWVGIQATPGPLAQHTQHAMAYDPVRQVAVLYTADTSSSATFEWDGTSWLSSSANSSPGAFSVYVPSMVWDSHRQRAVLHGGIYPQFNTWEYDGIQWALASGSSAMGHRGAQLCFDESHRETIAVGGVSRATWATAQDPMETLRWDGVTWQSRHVGAGASTSPRGIVADTARGVVVSFDAYQIGSGGQAQPIYGLSVREWDGRSWSHHTSATQPWTAGGHAMAFDSGRDVTVLFGGQSSSGTVGPLPIDQTWEWDGSNWTRIVPATSPGTRSHHGLAFDSLRARTVLFGGGATTVVGGYLSFGLSNETWTFDGATWTQLSPANSPTPRSGHGMAYDPGRDLLVLHGGRGGSGAILGDTWTFDGADWQPANAGLPLPAATDHAMCWDPSRQQVVAYVQNELWGFDGFGWNRLSGYPQPLPPANGGAMAFDSMRQALLVAGPNGTTRLLGDVTAPLSHSFGAGCPGSTAVPLLSSSLPRLGDAALTLDLDGARDGAPALFGLALSNLPAAIGSNCTVLNGNPDAVVFRMVTALGHAEAPMPVPLDLGLRGLDVFAQAVVLDPNAQSLGLAVSNGLRLRVGD